MKASSHKAIAIVGVGAILPDAPDVPAFWDNIQKGRYSITDVPPDRWDPALYYDPDPKVPDKSYSKIGGWVRDWEWNPMQWRLPIPPKVGDQMDLTQKWAIMGAREALSDYGYPERPLDADRTAVILGNAMGGDRHTFTNLRIYFPEYARELEHAPSFAALPATAQQAILREMREGFGGLVGDITEDTMPGELANIIAGRIANLFNFHGPNYVVDAACASAMAGITAAIEGLTQHDYDAVLTGGIDANMGASSFVKFCKIGALSATGTRPYAEGADGFVMGEGAALFLLKRLEDAERDGDKIYAVIRGLGGSSDGKGKGITAPNPVGQLFCIERAWENAGLSPGTVSLIEGHGTSTRVGDVIEAEGIAQVFGSKGVAPGSIPLGSVKSNVGHLKGAAGAAGILKATLALHHKMLPPSLNFTHPNPNIDYAHAPFYVNTELKPWDYVVEGVRRAGVSAFGFGGTNFHAVLEEYIPGRLTNGKKTMSVGEGMPPSATPAPSGTAKAPLRGALVVGGASEADLTARLEAIQKDAEAGRAPAPALPSAADLRAPLRLAIDYGNAAELADKAGKALKALAVNHPGMWKALRAQGIFRGQGPASKVAFLYTGQGSQYVNMLKPLRKAEPIVAAAFAEADAVMKPILGKPLSDYIFIDADDPEAVKNLEEDLRQTEITQPAVLATDEAMTRLMAAYGIVPDMVMGHSLGEYGALVAAGALPFGDALQAVSARAHAMTEVSFDDNGRMAAVFAPIEEVERLLETVEGYVVIANINSKGQSVIGGSTPGVEEATKAILEAGYDVRPIPVSHAFHTAIVAPASEPLMRFLKKLDVQPPTRPIIANVTGDFYPMHPGVVPEMIDILGKQVASPVQFVKGLQTLYDAGVRVFVETGPKKALWGFVEDVLGEDPEVSALFSNHPKQGDVVSFNQALCGLYAAGHGIGESESRSVGESEKEKGGKGERETASIPAVAQAPSSTRPHVHTSTPSRSDTYTELGRLFADFLDKGRQIYEGRAASASTPVGVQEPVVISGASLGLPGRDKVFDDANVEALLRGDQFIDVIPTKTRREMVDKHITRLVKPKNGEPHFEIIENQADVIKLAGRAGALDIVEDYGYPADRDDALETTDRLCIGAGIDALRDAGVPLTMHYKDTTTHTKLPERWMLPDALRDETGVIFASAFPGYDAFAGEMKRFYTDQALRQRLDDLKSLRARLSGTNGDDTLAREIDHRIHELEAGLSKDTYRLDRKWMFRILSMGHAQFAEYIGARGPNTQINAACASTTQAVSLAEDWIRAGRCRRVVIVAADNVTSDNLLHWIGAGFLATGAAATDEVVEEAALPFDRRRHGMIVGMGAVSIVVESAEAARERGVRPITEVLSTVTANSAFHGTRLDVSHIKHVMEDLVTKAERQWGIDRHQIAPQTVFVSHETYTPARGGSAQAEIDALRHVFGAAADQVVIANTKGYTGHAMGAGIEDVLAIKALETGLVPPVANFKEIDPDLGSLNLSKGGAYPVQYALRLGAGFGSQISMSLMRWAPSPDGARPNPDALGFAYRVEDEGVRRAWLARVSGYAAPELEVVKRTLRFKDQGAPETDTTPEQTAQPVQPPAPRPAAPEPMPEPAPVAAAPAAPVVDPIEQKVLALVAEQTGYPIDMLDLDLDLEADLGIDTVKQAELFAAVRGEYGIERDDNMQLRDFPTLAHTIQFVYDRRPDLKPTIPVAMPEPAPAPTVSGDGAAPAATPTVTTEDPIRQKVLALVAEQTGYPIDMLDLDLDLEADLGIDTVKQAELFAAVRGEYGIERDDNMQLRDFPTLAHTIQFVYDRRPDLKPTAPAATPVAVAAPEAPAAAPTGNGAAAVSAPAEVDEPVKAKVLQLIAEQTGYPIDMLDLDLDLEADLGIDTVKQAELFAAVRGEYGIERDDNMQLRDFPTLAHTIQFVYDRRPDLKPTAPATTPVAAATPEAPAATPAATDADPVTLRVLELVAEQTGYPEDMLGLDLDLEADLGIDTVKQAEMFANIRAAYDIERDDNLQLREYPTLAHVIQFVYDRALHLATGAGASSGDGVATPEAPVVTAPRIVGTLEDAASIPRRVPVPVLRPALDLCKATGVTLDENSRVVVMMDQGGVGKALVGRLAKRSVEVLAIDDAPEADALTARIDAWRGDAPVTGVYWLPALDDEGVLSEMDLDGWREALRVRVKLLYATMRALYEPISTPGTFLVAATRLGGQHGYDEAGAVAPLGGPVVGFTKTYHRERSDVLTKAVDFPPSRKTAALADRLLDETLRDPGVVEVGYQDDHRYAVGLAVEPVPEDDGGMNLNEDTVFVVTGAAGSIVSAITQDLAEASGGTFYLLDLVPKPDPADTDIERFVTDKDALKRDIFERLKAGGERATPAMVEKELAKLERAQAALAAIQTVEQAGGTAHYHSVNLLDADGIARVIDAVRERHGCIDVLLHAGGLEISRFLPDKEPGEFDLVFDVKSDGWFNLLHAIGDMPLGATVAFSSVAGRFGNAGQADYSAANDLLCKTSSSFRTTRPATRGLVIDWTAWGGIGMATRGSIPKMMEAAGIDMLPPEAGIPIIRRELISGGWRGEFVAGKALGILVEEADPTGGLDLDALHLDDTPLGPMATQVTGMTLYDGLTVETMLDPKAQPFLFDHRIDGTPVLPGVMGLEAFGEAATRLFPGRHVAAIEDVDFLAPFKFYRDEPRTVIVQATFRPDGDDLVAACRLIGVRALPKGREVTTHFTGQVRLSPQAPEAAPGAEQATAPAAADGATVEQDAVYRVYFHGPAYQVLETVWRDGDTVVGLLPETLPANHSPDDLPLVMTPRLIETCFQTAGIWEMGTHGRMGLPRRIEAVRCLGDPAHANGRLFAVVTPDGDRYDARVMDEQGVVYVTLKGYGTAELPGGVEAEALKPLQTAMQ